MNIAVGNVTTDGFTLLDRELTKEERNGVGFFSAYMTNRAQRIFAGADLLEIKHAGKDISGSRLGPTQC